MMKFKKTAAAALALTSALSLAGCVDPGEQYRPDVYDASEVNRAQAGAVIQIISVQPARIRVDNQRNQSTAKWASGLGGGALGSGLGTAFGGTWAGLGAGLGGAALGALAGNMIAGDHAIVNGASISYMVGGRTGLVATEVGKVCQWAPGVAQLVITQSGQTRILPNATCQRYQ